MEVSRTPLVVPFVGERYSPDVRLGDVVAPPYDVIDEAGRVALAQRHAGNVVHVILPQGNGDRYAHAAKILADWRGRGLLTADAGPALYVVRQRFATQDGVTHSRTGMIAAVLAEPFAGGRVRPHEHTHAGPKQDRLTLLRATGTMCEALLMLSRDPSGALREGLACVAAGPPTAEADLEGVSISLWRVDDAGAADLANAAGRGPLYIADGHHRYETAVAYRREDARADRTLGLIVPVTDPGLVVLPTHRLLRVAQGGEGVGELLPAGTDPRRALAETRSAGGGCLVATPRGLYRVVRTGGPEAKGLEAQPAVVRLLDVAWADHAVIPALQSGTEGLRYTPDLDAALAAVRKGEAAAAVLLNPPAVEQVLAVADAGAFMPPKATFFTPKVPSGLVFLRFATPTP
jgi:uncharacterized protein (DUF1015 family)